MTYKAVLSPRWKLKDEYAASNLPVYVSFYGALPTPREYYERAYRPSVEINDRGRITYSNFFFGKILQTMDEARAVIEKLNK